MPDLCTDLGFDLEDIAELGMDIGSIGAADFDDRGALDPQAYRKPARQKIVHPRHVSHASARKLARDLFPLPPGERVHVVVPGTFLYGDLVEAVAVEQDVLIEDLWIMTLSMNAANMESLKNLQTGDYVRDMHLMVSDYWYANERGRDGLVSLAYDLLDNDNFQLSVIRSHGKATLMRTDRGEHYVITGSANLRSTCTIENFTIENDRYLFDWYRGWMAKLEDQFFTVEGNGGSIHGRRCARKGDQWQILTQENIKPPIIGDSARPMRVQTEPQRQQEPGGRSSKEAEQASDVRR
jgi:hypothetical protein